MTIQLLVVEETKVSGKNHHLEVTGNFLTRPDLDWNLGSDERQLGVSGNPLDHRAGPLTNRKYEVRNGLVIPPMMLLNYS